MIPLPEIQPLDCIFWTGSWHQAGDLPAQIHAGFGSGEDGEPGVEFKLGVPASLLRDVSGFGCNSSPGWALVVRHLQKDLITVLQLLVAHLPQLPALAWENHDISRKFPLYSGSPWVEGQVQVAVGRHAELALLQVGGGTSGT